MDVKRITEPRIRQSYNSIYSSQYDYTHTYAIYIACSVVFCSLSMGNDQISNPLRTASTEQASVMKASGIGHAWADFCRDFASLDDRGRTCIAMSRHG